MSIDTKDFERHEKCEQVVRFQIERLDESFKWTLAETQQFKKDGKFIIFHPGYMGLLRDADGLSFIDEAQAVQTCKALTHICDRPLRVMRVQTVRIQRIIGKVHLPVGGL